ncbi:methyltransferase domain-containing protein [Streptomyces sp. NBC_01278]|uniref:methyltransferase domain-containing protein n=1 Tax=Streptomyces sp. NBC_01278 TaxID=2903809 RepID=UPI002E2FFD73|nr:methyltransferase domain-containing protein [Streptomyces sp. NBC_01278]
MAVVVMQSATGHFPAAVDRLLASAGLASRRVVLVDGATTAPADLNGVDGLIVLGDPGSAPAAAAGAGAPAVKAPVPAPAPAGPALVREALAAEVPVLALGTGTRLLARASGAAPASAVASAADGASVELTPSADSDPLFAGAARPSPGLRPAPEPLGLPSDSVVLASCDGYPDQAFRIGVSAWGVRFLASDGVAGDGAPSATGLDPWAEQLLGRFAALVAARAEHTATRAFFTRRADVWEERFAHQTPAYEAAVARMRMRPGGRAVDLGCGTGRAMPALRAQVGTRGQVIGFDVTPAMLAAAVRHGRDHHGRLLAADCTRLPLAGGCMHGIFSAGLLDHLPDPHTALREWARVSAGDGVLLLFHPSGRAERAARHGRPLDPGDLLAEGNLRPALETTGWHLDEYEDAAGHFLARAVRLG